MRHRRCALVLFVLLSIALPRWATGQDSPGWLEDSPPGGEGGQLAADGGDPNRLYVLAGFLYLSRNRGTTWQVVAAPRINFNALAAAPSRPGRVYIADHNILLRSDDGAASLEPIATSQPFHSPTEILVDPHDADRLYVYDGNGDGLLRSDDAGVSWVRIDPSPQSRLSAFTLSSDDPQVLLALNSQQAWRSEDRGASWESVLRPVGEHVHLEAAAFLSGQDALIAGSHLWISSDGGRRWEQNDRPTESSVLGLEAAGPAGRVYAFDFSSQVWRSDNGGRTWQQTSRGLEHRRIEDLLADPRNPSVVHAATERGGVFITRDGGRRWHLNSQGLRASVNHVLQLDSGSLLAATEAGLFLRRPGDVRWTRRGGMAGAARASRIVVSERGLYAAMQHGLLFSPDQGESWQPLEHPLMAAGCVDLEARGQPQASVLFCISPRPGAHLIRVRHSGGMLEAEALDLPREGPRKVAIDPHRPTRIYLATLVQGMFATRFGGLFVSDDDGQTWRQLPDPLNRGVLGVMVSPHDPQRLLAHDGTHVLVSEDSGETFKTTTLRRDGRDLPLTALAFDPRQPDTIYAASFLEFFVSRDGGESFSRHPASPAPAWIRRLSFSRADPPMALAATRAGVFKLDLDGAVRRIPLAFGGTATQQVTNSQLLIYNASEDAALSADVTFLSEEGRAAWQRLSVPARGVRQLPTAAGFGSGWLEARPVAESPDPADSRNSLGALNFLTAGHSVAAAAAESLRQSFVLPLLDGKISEASTLLAVANPAAEPSTVLLNLRNPDSGRLAQAEVGVPARGQILLSPSEIEWNFAPGLDRGLDNFVGYLEGEAAHSPVLASGLLQVNDDLATLTTAPASRPSPFGPAASQPGTIVFPQFGHGEANGARLTARLALFNAAPVPAMARVEFLTLDGEPLPTALNDDAPNGRRDVTLLPNALTLLEATMPEAGRLDLGWLRVRSARPLDGWLILQGNLGTAVLRGQPQPQERPALAPRQISLPFLNSAAPFSSTGLALSNAGGEEALADLSLYSADGLLLATSQFVLPPYSQRGAFLPEIDWQPEPNTPLPPLDELRGLVVVSSSDPVAASLIHLRPGHFALLPLGSP